MLCPACRAEGDTFHCMGRDCKVLLCHKCLINHEPECVVKHGMRKDWLGITSPDMERPRTTGVKRG